MTSPERIAKVSLPMRTSPVPSTTSKRCAAGPVAAYSGGRGRSSTSAMLMMFLVMLVNSPIRSASARVALAPLAHCRNDRTHALAAVGQLVLEPGRMLAVEAPRDQSLLLQRLEARGKRVGRHAGERVLQILEALRALDQQIAQDENRPALADQVERARDRAPGLVGIGLLWHRPKIAA